MTDQVTTRVCSKCKVDKTFDSFGKDASKKQGIRSQCNICNKEAANAWREANPEKVKAATKAWYEANPEKAKARSKAWREANPERLKAIRKAYVNRLTDAYVAGLLAINRDQCPQELIELKRINVLITREIRKQQCQN